MGHLFNQLFGEADPDEDVSPDTEDPELANDKKAEENGKDKAKESEDKKEENGGGDKPKESDDKKEENGGEKPKESDGAGGVARVNTRQWAIDNKHDPKTIFTKLFHDDIKYLLSMEKLWAKRKPPTPMDWDNLEGKGQDKSQKDGGIRDQEQWTLQQCADVFVAACANIRSAVFGIPAKTRFDVKSMAGNIIPALATPNAVIAGCIVMEALKLIQGRPVEDCKMVFMARKPNPRHKILVPCELPKPRENCYVCAAKPEVSIRLDLSKVTKKTLEENILKGALNMIAPDAEIDGKGVVLIDSEESGEGPSAGDNKVLKDFGLADGSVLSCDDFLQDYNVKVYLYQTEELADGVEFEVVGDIKKLMEEQKKSAAEKNGKAQDGKNGAENGGGDSSKEAQVDSDDDIVALDDDEVKLAAKKRQAAATVAEVEAGNETPKAKKARVENDEVVCVE